MGVMFVLLGGCAGWLDEHTGPTVTHVNLPNR
jgi:hypothetical protein